MYDLVSAIAKPLNGDGHWREVTIGDMALSVVFSTYARIIATLSNPFLASPVAVDLASIRPLVGGQDLTLNQFLQQNGDNTLPALDVTPVIAPRYAKYADAFHAGYKVAPIHPTAAPDAQLPLAEKTYLYLTRPDTDYQLFYKSCLVNVNGFFHLTDASTEGIYIVDGNKSAMRSHHNQIGICSFRELGTIRSISIKPEMVYKQNPDEHFKDRAYVDLGEDVSDKTVMLVLGGYLHVLDKKTFYRVSASAFAIDFGNLSLLDRYYESRKYLDFSSLPLSTTDRNDSQVSVQEFFSDANLLAYLTLSQSFFVVLDNSDIFVDHLPIKKTPFPDMFVSHYRPTYPLVVGVGKVANYWYTYEDMQYSITCHDSLRSNYVFDTTDITQEVSASDSRLPEQPQQQSPAFFLRIGCDLSYQ